MRETCHESAKTCLIALNDDSVAVASNGANASDVPFGESFGFVFGNGGNGAPTEGQYQLDITIPVPTPGALSLLRLGGLAVTRRKR